MKSIQQIFKNDKELLDVKVVQELISYCEELEDEVIENKNNKVFSKENSLTVLVEDIHSSLRTFFDDVKEYERFKEIEKPSSEDALYNLKKYLQNWGRENNFYFK